MLLAFQLIECMPTRHVSGNAVTHNLTCPKMYCTTDHHKIPPKFTNRAKYGG